MEKKKRNMFDRARPRYGQRKKKQLRFILHKMSTLMAGLIDQTKYFLMYMIVLFIPLFPDIHQTAIM